MLRQSKPKSSWVSFTHAIKFTASSSVAMSFYILNNFKFFSLQPSMTVKYSHINLLTVTNT